MKRSIALLLTLALLLSCCPMISLQAAAATEWYYTYTVSDGKATITECDWSVAGDITIPATLGGYPVTTIGESAFYCCYKITSVTIPDSVIAINDRAFSCCDRLTEVYIPDSVTTIGECAFESCGSLVGISVHSDNPYYCTDTQGVLFDKAKTTLVKAPVSLAGSYSVPDSVHTIAIGAFEYCTKLESIAIPDSVITIGIDAFSGCESLQYNIYAGLKYLGNVENPYYALIDADDTAITSCTITAGTKIIAINAFDGCDSLTGIWVEDSNANYSSDSVGVLFNKAKTMLIHAPCGIAGSYTIPDSVTTIGNYAFSRCDSLNDVTIGNSAITIGNSAFFNCDGLTSVTIPDSVTTIGNSAFLNCSNLASVTLGNGVITIGVNAFYDSGLPSVTIPSSVTTFSPYAFDKCTEIYIAEGNEAFCSDSRGVLFNKEKTELIRAPGSLKSYTIPNSVTRIGEGAFCECNDLTSVTIGNNISSIADDAFSFCTSLTAVIIPDSVTDIGKSAFSACFSLRELTIGNRVTAIAGWTFYNCFSLTSVTIPDSVTAIGASAFSGCDSLTSVSFGSKVTTIGQAAFESAGLTSVTIPDSVSLIGDYAFGYCNDLTSVTIGNGITTIGSGAFSSCTSLTDVYYDGTEEQWAQIAIDESNESLLEATLHTVAVITSISIQSRPSKTGYMVGETLDTTGLEVVAIYSDGSAVAITEGYAVSDFDSSETGTKTIIVTYKDFTATFEVYVVAEGDKVLDGDGNTYETLSEAVKNAAAGDKLTVLQDVLEGVNVQKSITLDLNGFSINGTLTVEDGCILYGMDVQTDDFTINDEFGYGKIQNVVLEGTGKLVGAPAEGDRHGYMMITEDDGVSFHCVNLKLNAMTLRAEQSGVYFKSDFAGDELVAENVKQFGVALSVKGMPTAENMEADCLYSEFYDFNPGSNGGDTTSTLLKGIMKQKNAALLNNRNANMPVYGRAYILTNDGQYIFGASASRSLRQQVEAIDTAWDDLSATQQAAVQQMYADFANVMKSWNIPNLKASIA